MNLHELSSLPCAEFTSTLAGIYEHSDWVARRAWECRPFSTLDGLHRAMQDAVLGATDQEQLALIRAHPELAGRQATAGTLTAASAREQRGAGLDRTDAPGLDELRQLNQAYRQRFGFPFIIAVKGLERDQIIEAARTRLQNDQQTELARNLEQIGHIARFRLQALLDPTP